MVEIVEPYVGSAAAAPEDLTLEWFLQVKVFDLDDPVGAGRAHSDGMALVSVLVTDLNLCNIFQLHLSALIRTPGGGVQAWANRLVRQHWVFAGSHQHHKVSMCQSYWYFIKLLGSHANKYFLHYTRYCTFFCNKSSQQAGESPEFPTLKGIDHPQE